MKFCYSLKHGLLCVQCPSSSPTIFHCCYLDVFCLSVQIRFSVQSIKKGLYIFKLHFKKCVSLHDFRSQLLWLKVIINMVVETIQAVIVTEKSQLCLCFCFLKKRSPFLLTQRFPNFLVLSSFKLLQVIFQAKEHYFVGYNINICHIKL